MTDRTTRYWLLATIVADSSHYAFKQDTGEGIAVSISCDLDGKGGGSCAQAYWLNGGSTRTTTYAGSAVPLATFIAENGSRVSSTVSSVLSIAISGIVLSALFV